MMTSNRRGGRDRREPFRGRRDRKRNRAQDSVRRPHEATQRKLDDVATGPPRRQYMTRKSPILSPVAASTSADIEDAQTSPEAIHVDGPHPGFVNLSGHYILPQQIQVFLNTSPIDSSREEIYRFQGVQLIDDVRQALNLPLRTFTTAVCYYHWFRLRCADPDYHFQDAALAALFLACKVEDTIKRSREIAFASYNLKYPGRVVSQDDKMFDLTSRSLIQLERHILEIVGFNFQVRSPHKHLIKAIRKVIGSTPDSQFFNVCFEISIDMYKSFLPLQHTTYTLVFAILRLASLLTDQYDDTLKRLDPVPWSTTTSRIEAVIFELLNLYILYGSSTKVGKRYDSSHFINRKVILTEIARQTTDMEPQHHNYTCDICHRRLESEVRLSDPKEIYSKVKLLPSSNTPTAVVRHDEIPVRFTFDKPRADREANEVTRYFADQYEEYQVEVEEPIPTATHASQIPTGPPQHTKTQPTGRPRGVRNGDSRGGRGGGRRNKGRRKSRVV